MAKRHAHVNKPSNNIKINYTYTELLITLAKKIINKTNNTSSWCDSPLFWGRGLPCSFLSVIPSNSHQPCECLHHGSVWIWTDGRLYWKHRGDQRLHADKYNVLEKKLSNYEVYKENK